MGGNEERTAVRVGLVGDLESAEPPRLVGDLELVHADEGTQNGQLRRLVDARQVVKGLGGHLAQALSRHEGEGARLSREGLGDAHHEPAIHDHAGHGG